MNANKIREARLKKGMTMTSLAIEAEVSLSHLSIIERGAMCTKQTANKLCEILCADPRKIFADYENLSDAKRGEYYE